MPDQSSNLTALRTDGHRLRAHLSIFKGAVVASGNITVGYVPSDYPLTSLDVNITSGSHSDIKRGFLVIIKTSAGVVRGFTRVRYSGTISSTALPIRELSRGEIVVANGDLFEVRREIRLSDRLVTATSTFDPDGETYTDQGSSLRPIVCSGGAWAGWVDSGEPFATVPMDGGDSRTTDPDSSGTINHTYTIPSGGGDFQSGSSSTDESPTLEMNANADGWLVEHEGEDDSNSETITQYVPIIVHNAANPPLDCIIESLSLNEQDGVMATVRVFENVSVDDVFDGSLAILWKEEWIAGTQQSFRSPVNGRSHILCVGYLRRDNERKDGTNSTLTFEVISPLARLGELPGFSKVMERNASPDSWSEIAGLDTELAILRLWQYYCNGYEVFDFKVESSYTSYDYPLLFLQADNPLGQIRELASATDARFTCDRGGRFYIATRLELMDASTRTSTTTTLTLTNDDIIDYEFTREHWRPVQTFRCKGFTGHATDPQPVFGKWPGDAPGQGSASGSVERLIAANASDLYARCGRYGAREDGWYVNTDLEGRFAPRGQLVLPGAYDVFDVAYTEWVTFNIVTGLRGIDLSEFRFIVESIDITFDGGTGTTTLQIRAETNGQPGTDDTPPASDTSGLTDWSDIWGTITFPAFDNTDLIFGARRLGVVWSDGSITLTDDQGGTWWVEHDLNLFIHDAIQDVTTPSTLHVVADADIYRLTGVGSGSVTPSSRLTFASTPTGVYRGVEMGRNDANKIVCISYDDSFGVNYATSGNAGGSYSEGNISANIGTVGLQDVTAIYINNVNWIVRTIVYDGAGSSEGYESGDGISWSSAASPNLTGLRRLGVLVGAFGAPTVLFANGADSTGALAVFTLFRISGSTQTDISPDISGTKYGILSGFVGGRRSMAIADNNPNKSVLIGRTGTNSQAVGIWKTSTLQTMATGAGWTLIVTPDNGNLSKYRQVEMGADGKAVYFLGERQVYISTFDNLAEPFTDISGNLTSLLAGGTAPVKLFGW